MTGIQRSRYRGCLLGGALGDALGAPAEGLGREEIRARFGDDGLRELVPWDDRPAGSYTDDTQLSIATARGCLLGAERWRTQGLADLGEAVHGPYLEWLRMQGKPGQRRGPGKTCLSALETGRIGTVYEPINESKGSGGVMRAAPVGLAFQPERAFEAGTEVAAVTHGHPSGYLAAGFAADMVARLLRSVDPWTAVAETREVLLGWDDFDEVLEAVDLAVEMPEDVTVQDALDEIGRGWVAEEALGMALLCVLRFPDDWSEAVLAGIDTDGDSDTVGGITGALMGTLLGEESLPGRWVSKLEDRGSIVELADEMYDAFHLVEPSETPFAGS